MSQVQVEIPEELKLRYVSSTEPGYSRKRWGRGFIYLDDRGEKITKPNVIKRIKNLVIPPVWDGVWICKMPNGHLQATGIDSEKRKQYLYHPRWTKHRNMSKFTRMAEFARALVDIRSTSEGDLQQEEWNRRKVLGLVVQVLDEGHMRIGNLYYRKKNNTYGLTTIRRKHLEFNENTATFEYKAKSGKVRKVTINDENLVQYIKECSELPGYEVFRYKDEHGKMRVVDSQDVNDYLRSISGKEFSSKDFRTWGGTVLSLEKLEEARALVAASPRRELIPTLVGLVAEELGNTKSICRDYYMHPAVVKAIESGEVDKFFKPPPAKYRKFDKYLEPNEIIALRIIESVDK